jgi:hypothetical protein
MMFNMWEIYNTKIQRCSCVIVGVHASCWLVHDERKGSKNSK